jgi:hypothetical protein
MENKLIAKDKVKIGLFVNKPVNWVMKFKSDDSILFVNGWLFSRRELVGKLISTLELKLKELK